MEISKTYNPKEVEGKWYQFWQEKGYFKAAPNPTRQPFTIVIPPPNVTDVLHLGQALNNTIQDIFIRWRRMQGYETEWLPGLDHAGIATQVIVEKEVLKNTPKEKIGREKFLEIIWEWVDEKRTTIIQQLKELGCSCDWDKTRFTMDEGLSQAVREVFVRLYNKGLIYKGDYIVNWCPRCETAIADEEVEHEEIDGKLYYIKYPIKNQKSQPKADEPLAQKIKNQNYIVVATTRPETMLGDTACAVNPKDKKNQKLIGKTAILPLLNREIPIIPDEAVDPKFGTGIVKVTPAHDPVDFEIAQHRNLPKILIMDTRGVINENGGQYKGLPRFEARKKVLADLKKLGLFIKTIPHHYSIGHCYRCNTVVEPILSKQWFVRMKELAGPALKAVEEDKIKFYPERWKGVYLNWMKNIRDWCISRQIWWGHQIPVWYCQEMKNEKCQKQNGIIVSKAKPISCPYCQSKNLVQDSDVLDTWFSSWLWPFSTFGWPEKTEELEYFYPTSILSTASEIIFFWVARMIMAGYEFMGNLPFRDVYIHGTVRDSTGRKMSKSLGNGIDPRDIIKDYGTDALRFSLITAAGEGQDPHMAPNTFESGRNFANKIWNAYRLISSLPNNPYDTELSDCWILSRLHRVIKTVTESLSKYRLQEPAMQIYDFFWHEFCDWYLEILKIRQTKGLALDILDSSLKLLHPFMPFITEEIWQKLQGVRPRNTYQESDPMKSIMISAWPEADPKYFNSETEEEFDLIKSVITTSRNTRSGMKISKTQLLKLVIRCSSREKSVIEENKLYIKTLGKIEEIEFTSKIPPGCASSLTKGVEIFIPLAGLVDLKSEIEKLEKEKTQIEQLLHNTEIRLASHDFISRAPAQVIENTKKKAQEYEQKLYKLQENISLLQHQTESK